MRNLVNISQDMVVIILIIGVLSLIFTLAVGFAIISVSRSLRDIRDLEFKKWKEDHQNTPNSPTVNNNTSL